MKLGIREGRMFFFLVPMLLLICSNSFSSSSEYSPEQIIEQSAVCMDCHDGLAGTLSDTPHRLSESTDLKSAFTVGCISCHDGWEAHLEDPSEETMALPSEMNGPDLALVCSRCHNTPHQSAMVTSDPHGRAGLNCASCHTVHKKMDTNPIMMEGTDNLCLTCHPTVASEFKLRSVHPLESGNVRCIDCHDISGITDPMFADGLEWGCRNCHGEQAGPFIHEHMAVNEFGVEGGSCTECHNPHGSSNERLLKQPGSGLCLQCHGMPPGHAAAHSGFVVRTNCVVCHSQVHGSNDNPLMLDPNLNSLFTANCFAAGCHGGTE